MKMQYKIGKSRTVSKPPTKYDLTGGHQCTVVHIELVTSWPVTFLWILLSWLVSTLATTAYVHPAWFVKESVAGSDILSYDRTGLASTLGMVSVCYHSKTDDKQTGEEEMECHNFGEDFPSVSWQTAYVLFGSGCVLLTWCSILAFCNVWIEGRKNRQLVAVMVGRIQLVAVILQSVSLLVYPSVLGSTLSRAHCGPKAAPFSMGGCRLGWAYVAAIASTVLAGYCPLLAYFSHHNRFKPCLWTEI